MVIKIEQVLDLGELTKQRILFQAVKDGNLLGHHLLMDDSYFYSFPYWKVRSGDYVVLYINHGEKETRKFADAVCHFLYCGKQIYLWEEHPGIFHLEFRVG